MAQADGGGGDFYLNLVMSWFTIEGGGGSLESAEFLLESTMGHATLDVLPDDPDATAASALRNPIEAFASGRDAGSSFEFALSPVTPNPCPGVAYVTWSVPLATHLRVTVHDVQGRQVAVLAEGEYTAGRHVAKWDAFGSSQRTSPGLYFVRLQSPDGVRIQRVVMAH